MPNKYLKPVYKQIFNKSFDYSDFDNRLQMQKIIYMLQELGAPVGDYGFRWYKHGPYSQELLDDMFLISSSPTTSVIFSYDAQKRIETIKSLVSQGEKTNYSTAEWVECLASILYLKKYIFPSSASKDSILDDLVKRKPHLKSQKSNEKAFDLISSNFIN